MAKSLRLHALLLFITALVGAFYASAAWSQAGALVGCQASDNGVGAAAHFRVLRGDTQISGAICGNDVAVPVGSYQLVITLDGVLGAQEQRVPIQARSGQVVRGRAAFETGELLIEITREGRRAAGLALLRQGGREIGRLSAGVATRIGVGTYSVEIESRGQRRRHEGVTISRGERRVIAVEFGSARGAESGSPK